jgi:mono/diheme cytochrome c family protein
MRNNQFKFLAVIGFVVLLFVVIGLKPQRFLTAASDTDAAAVYKTKCAVCHTAKAEKFFDLSKTDEQLTEIVLNGKKDAKPPMPAFATKGITIEQAKALVAYMRSLRGAPANTNVNTANVNATNGNAKPNANVKGNANANTPVNVNANTPVNINTNANSNANTNAVVNANTTSNTAVKTISNEELAALYKSKCAACHGAKAEKLYNAAAPLEEQATAILKGKKAAKPPQMPAFETKGIAAEKARALAEYMKSLRASN